MEEVEVEGRVRVAALGRVPRVPPCGVECARCRCDRCIREDQNSTLADTSAASDTRRRLK